MLQVTPKRKEDLETRAASATVLPPLPQETAGGNTLGAQKLANAVPAPRKANQPQGSAATITEGQRQQTRVPAILGDATFRGQIAVDGIVSGQPGSNGGVTSLRQHGRSFLAPIRSLMGRSLS